MSMKQLYPHSSSVEKRPIIDALRQSPLRLKIDSSHSYFHFGTSPVLNQKAGQRKSLKSVFLVSLMAITLSLPLGGCGWEWPKWEPLERDPLGFLSDNSNTLEEFQSTPPPPNVIAEDAPDQNDPMSQLTPASTLAVDFDAYFAQEIKDPNVRLMRLENAIIAMQRDFQNMPEAQKIARYKEPLPVEDLVGPGESPAPPPVQTQSLTPPEPAREVIASGGPEPIVPKDMVPEQKIAAKSAKPPSTPVYENVLPAPKTPEKVVPVDTGPTRVTGLRVGTHKNKVRIVMDVSRKTLYTADLDNAENLLIVELPDSGWSASQTKNFGSNPVLKSYSVDPYNDGKGHIVALELKSGSSILKQSQIPALSGGGTRIFIDLAI